ncbi:amino acid ABC transporter ATP-binding protein [Weizmannia acidilactici]|uniref:Amino acid ABC transporter ATP-binding protein n=1 Tax=Weizmannia acidilactici TaxID=2607726 RepID=A0A5J4JDN2_9BACI|nr:thiol reductant ABC exporter subunit CydC [Weizmannia acidilactici]GER67209.1 amino acid ABC transporter ATP-binding protein [Weizmannia acidilactici]GER69851.1 amino acid ABC transporter ATP-binding protein [Weizmannia acidilactici]GER73370.1 amino acid ABC transporter ATP-binding protein [Weizmannia acidilactici]
MKYFNQYIKPYIRQYRGLMILTVLLGILTFLASSMLTFTSGYLITRASEMPVTILLIYVPIVGVRAFGIARPVARYLERLSGHNTVLKILADMRVKLYEMLEPQALFIRSRFQTGDLLGTLADDIEHLQDAYIRTIFPTVTALFLFLYSTVVLAVFDWLFALWIAVCLGVIVFVYPLVSLYLMKKRQIELKETQGILYCTMTDTLFGIRDWIISGKKERFFKQFYEDSRKSHEIEKKMSYWNHSRTFQLQAISGAILIFVGIWAGHAALNGEIAPTYIASFTLVTLPILEGMIPAVPAVEKITTYKESLQRIDGIRGYLPEEPGEKMPLDTGGKADIRLEHVTYYYENEKEAALKDVSLIVPHGQKIALLGKSGAGKSTLLHLLVGALRPDSGTVTIGGHAPADYGEAIHKQVSVLNQKPYLFATTVENNVGLGRADATVEEIEAAIRQVKLGRYIDTLPNGIHTQMEETGQRFSGGERQRIALARILLQNTPIVILDEPTVGLDPLTEKDLLDTIFDVLHDKTVLLITHHLTGLEKMDQIIFLDDGKIAMQGTHAELMSGNARYRQLYEMDHGVG